MFFGNKTSRLSDEKGSISGFMELRYIDDQVNKEIAKYELPDVSKFNPNAKTMFPMSAEREYVRLVREQMKGLKGVILEYVPRLLREYDKAMDGNYREDDILGFQEQVDKIFKAMYRKLARRLNGKYFLKQLKKIANLTGTRSIREWKKLVKKNLGIDLSEDVFMGDTYQKGLEEWTKQNVNLIVTVPKDTLGQLEAVVREGFKNGLTSKALRDKILEDYNVSESRAEFWARDQVAKLNAQITEEQHRAAGVTKYRWSSSKDSRVRDCHRFYDGKIFSYDKPPEQWYVTKSRGIVHTGHYANPGMYFNCRCVAIPVFDETANWMSGKEKE